MRALRLDDADEEEATIDSRHRGPLTFDGRRVGALGGGLPDGWRDVRTLLALVRQVGLERGQVVDAGWSSGIDIDGTSPTAGRGRRT